MCWRRFTLILLVVGALVFATQGRASSYGSNYGGGDGGYSQLPTCGPAYYGQQLYVQGHLWRCDRGNPDHWTPLT